MSTQSQKRSSPRRRDLNGDQIVLPSPNRRPKRATLEDVAHHAGVSVSAVSKVVRNAYGVSDAMREKVSKSISAIGYRPNAGARAMRGKSYTVGIALPELTSPLLPEIAQAVGEFLEDTPYQDIIVSCTAEPKQEKKAIEALVDRQVDGVILIAPWMEIEWVETLAQSIPTVVVARMGLGKHFDSVTDDAFRGAVTMVSYLVNLGHTKIAHVGAPSGGLEPPFVLSHTSRQEGYEYAMKSNGLQPEVIISKYSEDGGYTAGLELLSRPNRPTAIFAGADVAALGVMKAADQLGLRVPDDVSITGYDDIFAAGLHGIGLTTMDQHGTELGKMSAELMLSRLDGRTESLYRMDVPSLVERTSAGPLPTD